MQPVSRGSLTTESLIQVDWQALSLSDDIGDSEIISYQLVWDSNTGTANIIAS